MKKDISSEKSKELRKKTPKEYVAIEPDRLDIALNTIKTSEHKSKIESCLFYFSLLSYLIFFVPLGIYLFNHEYKIVLSIYIVLFVAYIVVTQINKKKNSNILRIISFILILLSLLSLQNNNMSLVESYTCVLTLILTTLFIIYSNLDNGKFLIWISFLNYLILRLFIFIGFTNSGALILYSIFFVSLNFFIYKIFRNDGSMKLRDFVLFFTIYNIIEKMTINIDTIFMQALYIGLFLIIIGIYYFNVKDNRLKIFYYVWVLYALSGILVIFKDYDFVSMIVIYIATIFSIFSLLKFDNILMRLYSIIFLLLGYGSFTVSKNILTFAIYFILFSTVIWIKCKESRDSLLILSIKHLFFISVMYISIVNFMLVPYNICLGMSLCILYSFMLTYIDRLRDRYYQTANKYLLVFPLVVLNILGYFSFKMLLFAVVISFIILLLFKNEKFVANGFVKRHIFIIYAILLTYWIYLFCSWVIVSYYISKMILSLLLVILASVYLIRGLKLNMKAIENYGKFLLVIFTFKLLVFDLSVFTLQLRIIFSEIAVGVVIITLLFYIKTIKKQKNLDTTNNTDDIIDNEIEDEKN